MIQDSMNSRERRSLGLVESSQTGKEIANPEIDTLPKGFRAIALDIDGTLLRSDHSISDKLTNNLRKLNRAGWRIVLVSARPIRSVLQIAKPLGLSGPMVALNGALIADDQERILFRRSIQEDAMRTVFDLLKSHNNITWNVYSGCQWLVEEVDALIENEISNIGFGPNQTEIDPCSIKAEKILLMGRDPELLRFRERISTELPYLTYSISKPGYLEITAWETNKFQGLKRYLKHFNMHLSEVIAFGDGENDIEMIEKCGFGIAMGNATQSLKAVAKHIIGTNDEESISGFLDLLF